MATLAGNTIASTYPLLLKIDSSGIDGTLRAVEDGDGTDSALSIATDSVLVKGDGVKLYFYDADGGEHISANTGGVLSIAGASEIDLTATAIDINGTVDISSTLVVNSNTTITTADNLDTLTLISTDADANIGPNLRLYRNSGSPADNDAIATIQMEGRNDNSQDVVYNSIESYIIDASDGTEDTEFVIRSMRAGTLVNSLQMNNTETNINQEGIDVDFRVESSGNANMLFVDAGNNKVGIGRNDPAEMLHVASDSIFDGHIKVDSDTKGLVLGDDQDVTLFANAVGTVNFVRGTDVDIANDDTEGWVALHLGDNDDTYIQMNGGEGGDAVLYMYGDQGDTHDDRYKIQASAAGELGIMAFTTGSWVEHMVFDSSANSLRLLNENVFINDSANGAMTRGLTINQGSADDECLTLKSSDVAHGRTSYTETDTYLQFKKVSSAEGGSQIVANMEDGSNGFVMSLVTSGGQADTTKSGSAQGLVKIWTEEHNGSNGAANITANGNIFAVSGYIGGGNTTVFLVDEDGDIHYDGSDAGAYDYAEMFEWEDGNPDDEDRVGYSVSLVGEKIKKAEEGETVIGIVSAVPAVCGDSPMEWQKRYKTDEWGRKVHKEVDCVKFEIQHETEPIQYYDENDSETKDILYERNDELPEGKKVGDVKEVASKKVGDVKKEAVVIAKEKHYEGDAIPSELPDDAVTYKKLISQNSDEYDSDQEYIPRKERKEWSPVGLVGKLRMRKGQLTASSWIKMKDEGNNIEMWFVK